MTKETKYKTELYYKWKTISEDGLLKDPKERGPYYSTISLNNSYNSKEEALEDLEVKRNDFYYEELTLVEFHRVVLK